MSNMVDDVYKGSQERNFLGHPIGLSICFLTEMWEDRKSTRLNSSHDQISYAVFCL